MSIRGAVNLTNERLRVAAVGERGAHEAYQHTGVCAAVEKWSIRAGHSAEISAEAPGHDGSLTSHRTARTAAHEAHGPRSPDGLAQRW